MSEEISYEDQLFKGLKALTESAFPKKCASCGAVFETADQFFTATELVGGKHTGLTQAEEEDGSYIVESFRNCPCGSTMLVFFSDRRDTSEAGLKRRENFEKLLDFLDGQGLDREIARKELIKVVRGERSEIIEKYRPQNK